MTDDRRWVFERPLRGIVVALCATQLAACEGIVGIKDVVPVDVTGECMKLDPIDFATTDLGILWNQGEEVGRTQVVDLTGDGKLDLAWVYVVAPEVHGRLKRNITPPGTPPGERPMFSDYEEFRGWHGGVKNPFVDINSDSKVDFLTDPGAGGFFNMAPPGATPEFANGFVFGLGASAGAYGMTIARLNSDNKPDFLAWSTTSAHFVLNLTTMNATTIMVTTPAVTVPMAPSGYLVSEVQIGDIDGDGRLDLVAASHDPQSRQSMISVALNKGSSGTPSFGSKFEFPQQVLAGPLSFQVSDIDGDGKPDVVVGGAGATTRLRLLRNTTSAQAASPTFETLMLDDNQFSVIRDFDGDGKPDIAYYSDSSSAVVVRRNITMTVGQPDFDPVVRFSTAGLSPFALEGVDDMNADGKPDMTLLLNDRGTVRMMLWTTGSHCPSP